MRDFRKFWKIGDAGKFLFGSFSVQIEYSNRKGSRKQCTCMGEALNTLNEPIQGASPWFKSQRIETNGMLKLSLQRLLNDGVHLVKSIPNNARINKENSW